jgi:hypothetical protein
MSVPAVVHYLPARRSQRTTPREHLAVLDRRVEFLRHRSREHRRGEGYERAERAALEWALAVARERLAEAAAATRREGVTDERTG